MHQGMKDRRSSINLSLLSKYGIYFVLLGLIILLSFTTSSFLTLRNVLNVLRQVSINGIIAVGMTFVLITGGIDLSAGAVVAYAGVVASSFSHPGEHATFVPILVGILVGAVLGFANGSAIALTKIPPFIVTLGMTQIASGMALLYSGGRPITNLSEAFQAMGQGMVGVVPLPIFLLLGVVLAGTYLLHFTRFGRYTFSIGGNETTAIVSGINIKRIKIMVYTMAGTLYGLAAIILSARTNSGAPSAGSGYELNAIGAVVNGGTATTGGRGTMIGTMVGALIMGILSNGLDILNVSSYYQSVIKGVIIIGAVWLDTTITNRD